MKKRLLAVLFTVVMSLTVGLFATACGKNPPPATTYNVTFDYGYDGAPDAVVVQVTDGSTVEEPTAPTRTGWTFLGWYDASGNAFVFTTPITGDITLKAKWEVYVPPIPSYNITFTETAGVKYLFDGTKPTSVDENTVVEFEVEVSPYHEQNAQFAVKSNGTALTATAGVYSVTVTAATTITVEGVVACDKTMGGTGTEEDPYTIGTPAQWLGFVEKVNDTMGVNKYFELADDIDFKGYAVPVIEAMMYATFEGAAHKLSNALIEDAAAPFYNSDSVYAGFIAHARYCDFYNLEIENITLNVSTSAEELAAGALVGSAYQCFLANVHVTGKSNISVFAEDCVAGGLVGQLIAIEDCMSSESFASILYCSSSANVTASGDYSGVGGIVGSIAGSDTDWDEDDANCYAYVAYCAVTGTLTSGFVGGIAALVQTYVAIQNCYFAGTQNSDSIYGGIAGVIYDEETVIANCFSTAEYTPGQETGHDYGRMIQSKSSVRDYESDTYIADCYYAPNGEFTDEEEHTLSLADETHRAAILALLKWNAQSWEFENGLPVAQIVENANFATIGVTPEKAFKAGNDTIPAEKQTFGLGVAAPLTAYSVLITGSYDGLLIASTENGAWYSAGYYLNNVRLPGAYLITDNTDAQDIVLKFVNYNSVAGEYYFTSYEDEENYKLALYNDGTASVLGNDRVARFTYAYFGEETHTIGGKTAAYSVIALCGAPTYVFNRDLNPADKDGDEILPRVYLDGSEGKMVSLYKSADSGKAFFEGYSYSDVVGTWVNGGNVYQIGIDRTGTYTADGTPVAFTWEYAYGTGENPAKTGITITFTGDSPDVTLTFGTEENNGKLLKEDDVYAKNANAYAGKYMIDVYSQETLEISGNEAIGNDGTFEVNSVGYTQNAGFIQTADGETLFYADNSYAGLWYGQYETDFFVLELMGLNIYNVGEARLTKEGASTYWPLFYSLKEEDADTLTFTIVSTMKASLKGTLTVTKADAITDVTMALVLEELKDKIGDSLTLAFDDVFRGDWYATDGTKYSFEGQTLTIGTNTYSYTYVDRNTIEREDGTQIVFTPETKDKGETLTLGTDELLRGDIFGSYSFVGADGEVWLFNGLGIANKGELEIVRSSGYKAGFSYYLDKSYEYSYDPATGLAEIFVTNEAEEADEADDAGNEGDNDEPVVTVTKIYQAAFNGGIVTLTPYGEPDETTGEQTLDASGVFTIGIQNYWTGSWVIEVSKDESVSLQVGVMNLAYELTVSAEEGSAYADIVSAEIVGNGLNINFYNASGEKLFEGSLQYLYNAVIATDLSNNATHKNMLREDVFKGEWANEDGTLEFDGFGLSGGGIVTFMFEQSGQPIEYETMYGIIQNALQLIYLTQTGYSYWYDNIFVLSTTGIDEAGHTADYYAKFLDYTVFEGVGSNEGYVLVLHSYCLSNSMEGLIAGKTAYSQNYGEALLFLPCDMCDDVLYNKSGTFFACYYPDTGDTSQQEFLIYEVTNLSELTDVPGYEFTITLYSLQTGKPAYTAVVNYTASGLALVSITPVASEPETEALAA